MEEKTLEDTPLSSNNLEELNSHIKKYPNLTFKDVLAHVTKRNLPWVLSKAVREKDLPPLRDLLETHVFSTHWDSEAFEFFFDQNDDVTLEQNIVFNLLKLMEKTPLKSKPQIFLILQCCRTRYNEILKGWDTFLKDMCNARMTEMFAEGAENDTKKLFYTGQFRVLWKRPVLIPHLVYAAATSNPTSSEYPMYKKVLESIPAKFVERQDYMLEIILHLSVHIGIQYINLRNLPKEFSRRIENSVDIWMNTIPLDNHQNHLIITEIDNRNLISSAIRQTVYEYMDSVSAQLPKEMNLAQDLNILFEVHRSRVVSLRDITKLFSDRLKKEEAKVNFFAQAQLVCDHFFFTLLPESTIKLVLPPTAVGSAATNWLRNLSARAHFRSPTEAQTLELFAKLLAQNVVSNDPLLPENEISPENLRQNHFLHKFLLYSFSTLGVEATLRNASSAVVLLGSEHLDKPNLFLQCIQHWAKGNMKLMTHRSVPSFTATQLTFNELHLVLEKETRLKMLSLNGAPVFSFEECEKAAKELKVLNRLSDIQVICAYSSFLPEKFADYLLVERAWLDSVSEEKWAHEKVERLLRCTKRINLLFENISPDVQQLIVLMTSKDSRKKSFIFDNFMREYFNQIWNRNEVRDISHDLKKALSHVKERLKVLLVSLEDESLTTVETKNINELLKKGGWSMEQELKVLNESGVYKLNNSTEKTILNHLISGEENCSLLEGVQRLLFPEQEMCTLQYFGFEFYTTQKDADLLNLKTKIESAPCISNMSLTQAKEYSSFVVDLFSKTRVVVVARIFSILADLKRFENVWKFFEHNPNFVGSDGMCTYNFVEQVDGYLARLGKGKADIVESFKFLSQFVVVLLRGSKSNSFKDLMKLLIQAPAVIKQTAGEEREWYAFVDSLISLNGEMRVVEDVFKGKEDPYDAVVSLYEYAQKGYIYYYKLDASEVSMSFKKEEIVENLGNNDTLEFQLQLRFALRDDSSRFSDAEDGTSADTFLRELESFSNLLGTLQHLHSVGHPKFSSPNLLVVRGENPPISKNLKNFAVVSLNDMKKLDEMQMEWAEELFRTTTTHPWLSLISTPLAREISLHLRLGNIPKVTLMIYPFLKNGEFDSNFIPQAYEKGKKILSHNWLTYLTKTIGISQNKFPSPQHDNIAHSTDCKLFACELDYDVWFAIETIYNNGKPLPFQILWCESSTDSACLEGLLSRAKKYTQFIFTVVRPELLPYPKQQRLLQYLLQEENVSNIRFVECAESLVRSAHRVKVEMEFSKQLSKINNSVLCFCGKSGTGKTFQLHKALAEAEKENFQECRIVITESFRISDAVEELHRAAVLCCSTRGLVVAFRFSVGCFSSAEKAKWQELFRMVNTVLYSLLKMRYVEDSVTGMLVCIPDDITMNVLVELPPTDFFSNNSTPRSDVIHYFPLLENEIVTKINCREKHVELGSDAKEVAQYLKAYEDLTIDGKYDDAYREDFDVLFLLDISGSMRKNNRLEICKDSIVKLVKTMTPKDRVGLSTYNENVLDMWDINFCTPGNLKSLRTRLDTVEYMGGSHLYKAILHGVNVLTRCAEPGRNQYLVVLSDGAGEGVLYSECAMKLADPNTKQLSVVFMAIDIPSGFRSTVEKLIIRSEKDYMISTTDKEGKIAEAFGMVGQHMSVTDQIKKNAEDMKDEDVPRLIWKYMDPKSHSDWSRVHMMLWIRYMRRRCSILSSSARFNKNTDKPTYGSTTMKMMLMEAEHAVAKNHVQWTDKAHEHMVYRAEIKETENEQQTVDYTWSVIAMNQEKDDNWNKKQELMETLQIFVPDEKDLQDSRVLESYLAYGTGAVLDNVEKCRNSRGKPFDFPLGHLSALRENRFVLTLDYLMKMLMINERVNCQAPCIIMGETGVSKTRVTEMLFKLKNYHKTTEACELGKILNSDENVELDNDAILQNLCQWLRIPFVPLRGDDTMSSIMSNCSVKEDVRKQLGCALLELLRDDPSLDPLADLDIKTLQDIQDPVSGPENICKIIDWLMSQTTVERCDDRKNWMFVVVNMHSAMTAKEIELIVSRAAERARRLNKMATQLTNFLLHGRAQICIFFDEFNTSSCMGLLKEIIQDRTLRGRELPENLVPIAACNPYRKRKQVHDTQRMNEQGTDWMSGHYNVRPLPPSLFNMTWDYGSLAPSQEEEFIRKRMKFEKLNLSEEKENHIVQCIMTAHCTTRELAKMHLREVLADVYPDTAQGDSDERGNSAVSLRDILRFFRMFQYFRKGTSKTIQKYLLNATDGNNERVLEDAMILSIALVYYLRLSVNPDDSKSFRKLFSKRMKELGVEIEETIQQCFDKIIGFTELEPGVVRTRSLQENIATILLSVSSRTPLIIKGPPGTSKTLAVQILCENAHGEFSKNDFYRSLPAMNSVHYQCSRHSSSKEITEIFERAIKSQKSSNEHGSGQTVYFVFMDEAGLPEEERESLKVLHYYLESNTRRSTEVGFVAITNQLLDAANSNRCNMLSRAKYDGDELKTLAEGCLSLRPDRAAESIHTRIKLRSTEEIISLKEVIYLLCDRFENFISTFQGKTESNLNVPRSSTVNTLPDGCADFFSLRDFMHLFKLFGRILQRNEKQGFPISIAELVEAFQRNFNGLESDEVQQLIEYFLADFSDLNSFIKPLMNPLKLVEASRKEAQHHNGPPVSRYILVTDTTTCDAVLVELRNLFGIQIIRLGLFNHSMNQEQMNALGEVCWSASRGYLIGLANTQSIHESLYDLFNQHYKVVRQNQKTVLRTNIAVGSLSVACDVATSFGCIVFMSESELHAAPAAFLDRLEKYRITMRDILHHYLSTHLDTASWHVIKRIARPLYDSIVQLIDSIGFSSFYGLKERQSVESAVISLLRRWETDDRIVEDVLRWKSLANTNDFMRELNTSSLSIASEIKHFLQQSTQPSTQLSTNFISLLFEVGQRELVQMFLSVAIPEKIVFRLPSALLEQYLQEKNFSFEASNRCVEGQAEISSSRKSKDLIFTRYISAEFRKKISAREMNNFEMLNFSTISTETELKSQLNEIWISGNDIIVQYELSRSGISQLNLCRHYIDALSQDGDEIKSRGTRRRKIIILVLISSADTLTLHAYDTVFNTDWNLRFIDSIGSDNIFSWLRVGFDDSEPSFSTTETHGNTDAMISEIRKCVLETCAPLLVGSLKLVSHPCSAAFSKYVSVADIISVLSTKVKKEKTSFADFVAQMFSALWCEGNANKNISGIRQHIRSIVHSQSESPLTGCLGQTFQLELNELLARQLVYFLKEAFVSFNTFPVGEEEKECVTLFLEIFESIPAVSLFQLGAVNKALYFEQIDLPFRRGFPFYKKVLESISHIFSQTYEILKNEDNDDDDENEDVENMMLVDWEDVLEDAYHALEKLEDPVAKSATKRLWNMKKNTNLFAIYLENFVADQYPLYTESTREHAVEWLQVRLPEENAIPMVHILNAYKKKSLSDFLSKIENITKYLIKSSEIPTGEKISLRTKEDQIHYLFTFFKHAFEAHDSVRLSSWLSVTSQYTKSVERKNVVSLCDLKLYAMSLWVSVSTTEKIIFADSSRKSSSLTTASVLPRVYNELFCTIESSKIENYAEFLLSILLEADNSNTIFYVSRVPAPLNELTCKSIWEARQKVEWDPALVSLTMMKVKKFICSKELSIFESFESFFKCISRLGAQLEISDTVWTEAQYIPSWIHDEEACKTQEAVSMRIVFVLLWNWSLVWYQDKDILKVEEILVYLDSLCPSAIRSASLAVVKHLFVKCIVSLCLTNESECPSTPLTGKCVEIFVADEKGSKSFWSKMLWEELKAYKVGLSSISKVKRNYPCLGIILNNNDLGNMQSVAAKKRVDNSGTLSPFPSKVLNVYGVAKKMFSDEIQAIEIMQRMWIIPLVMDMYSWVWANRHRNGNLLEISDPNRRSKWNFLNAALIDAKESCPRLSKIPDLNECDSSLILLGSRDSSGKETKGLLHRIAKYLITAYEENVLHFIKNEMKTEDSFLNAQNLFDIADIIDGNEKLIGAVKKDYAKTVSPQLAENIVKRSRRRFEICSCLTSILLPLSIFSLSRSSFEVYSQVSRRIKSELQLFIERHTLIIPKSLWSMHSALPTFNHEYSWRNSVDKQVKLDNCGLNSFFHSLTLHGLRQLRTVVMRAQDQSSNNNTRLEDIMRKWVEEGNSSSSVTTVAQWLSDFIGSTNIESCSILLSLHIKDSGKVIQYADQQISDQSYVFADKPIELKEKIPESVDKEIKELLKSVTREELALLTSFLSENEEKIERNARRNQINHQLIALLAESFQSREMLYRQHPVLLKIDKITKQQLDGTEGPFILCSCHYISFLQCLLHALRHMDSNSLRNRTSNTPSTWAWQTQLENSQLCSPEEVNQDVQHGFWDFLLYSSSLKSETGGNTSRVEKSSRNLRRIRGQLALQLKNFNEKMSTDAIHELLVQLPQDDRAPITLQAISLLDSHRLKLEESYNIIRKVLGKDSESVNVNVDTRELGEALQFIRNAEELQKNGENACTKNECDVAEQYYKTLIQSLSPSLPASPLPWDEHLYNIFYSA